MNRTIRSLLCLCACVSFGTADAANLLKNNGFENGVGNSVYVWTAPQEPGVAREEYGTFGYTLPNGTFPEGAYVLKFFAGNMAVSQENIFVVQQTTYTVSGWFYHSSTEDQIASDARSLRGFLYLSWFDHNGILLREDFTENHNGLSPSNTLVKIEHEFIAPVGAATASVHVKADSDIGGGSFFVDDIFFGPTE